jgi:hypothetical protein
MDTALLAGETWESSEVARTPISTFSPVLEG